MSRVALSAVAGVLLLHAALWFTLWSMKTWPDRQADVARATQAPLVLRLLALPTPTGMPEAPSGPAATRPAAAQRPAEARRFEPQAITAVPAVDAEQPSRPAAPVMAAPGAAADAGPAPLLLTLPKAASAPRRNPALDDPRSNTGRASLESRRQAAIGGVGGQVVEERLDDGRMRLRRGTSCVLMHPSRAARIDPFNQSFSPTVRGVEGC